MWSSLACWPGQALLLIPPSPALAEMPDPRPIVARDGERIEREAPIRFALVGGYHQAPPSLDVDLREQRVDFVVLAGDAVARSTPSAYHALWARLRELPASPLPGPGERRGDLRLRRYGRAWEGLGVRGLPGLASWRAFDLRSLGHTWRVVVLDADEAALGARFQDERFWLPKVISEGDEPLIVLLNAPLQPLAAHSQPERGAIALHTALRRHVSGSRVSLVATSGPVPELALPGGHWGEAWLGVGRAGGTPDTLLRRTGALQLEPGLDAALVRWFAERGMEAELLEAGIDYDAERWPLLGWWLVTLEGERLTVELRLSDGEGWAPVYAMSWTRGGGWTE